MSYSPFFQTLHDETKPVAHLGRGTHYTVLRAPIWHDEGLNPLPQAALLDFAIIWVEDHDERVMGAIEALYFRGLLAPVRFVGERKGTLCVLLEANAADAWDEATLRHYREAVSDIGQSLEDPRPVTVKPVPGPQHSIIHAAPESVTTYLNNIDMLWQLGSKPSSVLLKSAVGKPSKPSPSNGNVEF